MDIRDSIRKKIKEAQKIREANRWSPDTQPNIYELENFLRKSGYRLVDILDHEDKGIELIIEPIKSGYLYPEISHDIEEGAFYAKVVEHGMLVASDIEEIVKGYTTALGVLNHLDELDLSTLEITPDDEE